MNKAIATQINTRLNRIKGNIHNMQNARAAIIKDLIYLSDHKRDLKAVTGKTFDEIVKEFTGFSRRYFNQLVSNYKYLEKYNRLELFNTIDVKAIEHVKKINKPELLDEPENLTRSPKVPGDRLPILDAEIIEKNKTPNPAPAILDARCREYVENYVDNFHGAARLKAIDRLIAFLKTLK